MSDLVRHPLGVHLALNHADHIADVGLGYSGIRDLATNPVEWHWRSPWNPLRPPEPENHGALRGSALHTNFLDGLRTYRRVYGIRPSAETHPDHLDTIPELLAACRGLGLSTAHVVKADLVSRLQKVRRKADRPLLLATELQRFMRSGRVPISAEDDRMIALLRQMAFRAPLAVELESGDRLSLAEAFKNALTEISVFWEDENGVRQRARFDLLKPNFSGDLKAITSWRASDFKQSLLREAVIRGYVIQAVHYDEARRQLRRAVDEGRVFGGNKTQRARLTRVADADVWAWLWVFCKMDGAPQVRAIPFSRTAPQYAKAVEHRARALDLYSYYVALFGLDQMWVDLDVVWEPDDVDWPSWSTLPENL